jgi:hypothetical protein
MPSIAMDFHVFEIALHVSHGPANTISAHLEKQDTTASTANHRSFLVDAFESRRNYNTFYPFL